MLGSGAWGTALALLLMRNGHEVTLWASSEEKAEELRRTGQNPALPGIRLPDGLQYTASLKKSGCFRGGDHFCRGIRLYEIDCRKALPLLAT